jgi:hypothetical protein
MTSSPGEAQPRGEIVEESLCIPANLNGTKTEREKNMAVKSQMDGLPGGRENPILEDLDSNQVGRNPTLWRLSPETEKEVQPGRETVEEPLCIPENINGAKTEREQNMAVKSQRDGLPRGREDSILEDLDSNQVGRNPTLWRPPPEAKNEGVILERSQKDGLPGGRGDSILEDLDSNQVGKSPTLWRPPTETEKEENLIEKFQVDGLPDSRVIDMLEDCDFNQERGYSNGRM